MTFGYMEEPNVPHGLALCRKQGWKFDIMSTSFLVSRRSLRLAAQSAMPAWQSRLFIFLARNAAGNRLFPHSGRPGGGDRHAGEYLISTLSRPPIGIQRRQVVQIGPPLPLAMYTLVAH